MPAAWPASREVGEDLEKEDGDEYVVNALQGWPRTFTQPMRRPDYLVSFQRWYPKKYCETAVLLTPTSTCRRASSSSTALPGPIIGGIPTDFLPEIAAGLVDTRLTLIGCNENSCFDDDEDLLIDLASLERSFWTGFLLLVFLS
ncbi:hypothetical protein HK405_014819 [Cladochytrium tenue]|nr:hypothetical protein HK405_014819 [Cladochytrium tenue]